MSCGCKKRKPVTQESTQTTTTNTDTQTTGQK